MGGEDDAVADIAGDAGSVMDECAHGSGESVEEGGLSDIDASCKGDDGQRWV